MTRKSGFLFSADEKSPVLSSLFAQPFSKSTLICPAKKFSVLYVPFGTDPGSVKFGGRHWGAHPWIVAVVPV